MVYFLPLLLSLLSGFYSAEVFAVHLCNSDSGLNSNCITAGTSLVIRTGGETISTSTTVDGDACSDGCVINGKKWSSTTSDCLTITAANVTIRNSEIGPCDGAGHNGIRVNAVNFNLEKSYIHDVDNNGIVTESSSSSSSAHRVYMTRFFHNRVDILISGTGNGWTVEHSHFIDGYNDTSLGGIRGQAIQTRGGSKTSGSTFRCNRVDNTGLRTTAPNCANNTGGFTGDFISVIDYPGTSSKIINIYGNILRGGNWMQVSSVNINPGDYASNGDLAAWTKVERNIMIKETATCGGATGTAGGHDIAINDNAIAGKNGNSANFAPPIEIRKGSTGNVCGPYTVGGNKAYYTNLNNTRFNGSVRAGCSTPTNWNTNDWDEPSYTHPNGTVYDLTTTAGRTALYNGSSLDNTCNACGDGVDNDNDGTTDYPNDSSCVDIWDNSEGDTSEPE